MGHTIYLAPSLSRVMQVESQAFKLSYIPSWKTVLNSDSGSYKVTESPRVPGLQVDATALSASF